MYAIWRKLDVLIFMENLQWISWEISFSSTFQPTAIFSLGGLQLVQSILWWIDCVHHHFSKKSSPLLHLKWDARNPRHVVFMEEITAHYWAEKMLLTSLSNDSVSFRAASLSALAFPMLSSHEGTWACSLSFGVHLMFLGSRKCTSHIFIFLQRSRMWPFN